MVVVVVDLSVVVRRVGTGVLCGSLPPITTIHYYRGVLNPIALFLFLVSVCVCVEWNGMEWNGMVLFSVLGTGETFTAYLGVLNVSRTLHVTRLTVSAQLQTPSQRWQLASRLDA
jgi:Protein of unknown function (DUF974)